MSNLLRFQVACTTRNYVDFLRCIEDMEKQIAALNVGHDYVLKSYSYENISTDVLANAKRLLAEAIACVADIKISGYNINNSQVNLQNFDTYINNAFNKIVNATVLNLMPQSKKSIAATIAVALAGLDK